MKAIAIGPILVLLAASTVTGQGGAYGPPVPNPNETPPADTAVAVFVDVMPACPRRGCWAATCEALQRLEGVGSFDAEPTSGNLRRIHLSDNGLPDPEVWEAQFREYVGTASEFRNVVVSLIGTLDEKDGRLTLSADEIDPVTLVLANRKLHWDETQDANSAAPQVRVTGPLKKTDAGFVVEVRELSVVDP